MKKNTIIRSLLVASLAVLGACGGDDGGGNNSTCLDGTCSNINVVPPIGPGVPGASGDYLLQNVIPMLQQQYGNVSVQRSIPLMDGFALAANTYSWATLYQTYMLGMISNSGCQIQNQGSNSAMSPWGTLNYGCFQNRIGNYANAMGSGYVQFEHTGYNYYSFFEILNWFMGTGSSYAQNYYSSYGNGVNYYQPGYSYYQPSYCYDPYWSGSYNGYGNGGYQAPYYSTGSRYYVNIGFSGSF